MGRRSKKKTMIIGHMVITLDPENDGQGDNYKMDSLAGKRFLPRMRDYKIVKVKVEKPEGEDGDEETERDEKVELNSCQRYMHFVWDIFEDTEGSKLSSYINFWIMGLICCAAVTSIVETIPSIHKSQESVWFSTETFFVANFSIEFFLRALCTPSHFKFWTTVMNYIDLIAILPYYIELAGSSGINLGFLRILRLSRAVRLIKMSKYSQGIRLVTNAMVNSIDALQLFALLLLLVLVVFSSGIYYTERGDWVSDECPDDWIKQFGAETSSPGSLCSLQYPMNCTCIKNRYYRTDLSIKATPDLIEENPSPFQSVPQSFWWCIVTLTTVGYGDQAPYYPLGKIVGVLTMMVGLIMLALPLSIIGTNFIEERNVMVMENKRRDKEEAEAALTYADREAAVRKNPGDMRKELRELLMKSDHLAESVESMSEKLFRCIRLIQELRRMMVEPSVVAKLARDSERSDTPVSPDGTELDKLSDSSPGVGVGAGTCCSPKEDEVEVPVHIHYAVPTALLVELKELCLEVLKSSIEEVKVWDPVGEPPEMPAHVSAMLGADVNGFGKEMENHTGGDGLLPGKSLKADFI